jgi:ubiquinone/menaquinone biosynthesis C-methylase UbiE
MKMNSIEKALMNNPVRAMLQRRYEAPRMERFGGRTEGLRVLEIGCGRGVGTEIIFDRFRASEVHAFDLDPEMVALARKRLSAYGPERLRLYVGDAIAIAEEDASFDAVFDFGILHHVKEWKAAVAEVARVLKAGGRFYFEEVTSKALNRWVYRTFLEHPIANRFSAEELVAELERQGIAVGNNSVEWLLGDFVTGMGRREAASI